MKDRTDLDAYELGFDIPALPGMDAADIQTPALVLDLDALERNIAKMGAYAKAHGMRHRVHGKMHKSVDIARLQMELGGACGVCCQKVSEAEVFARGGITDVLVSNQVRDPLKIDRLARLPLLGARTLCCVDDIANVADLSEAATRHGTQIECLIEIDCGAGRCGVTTTEAVVEIARAIDAAPGLKFGGLQAYQGAMQHLDDYAERKAKIAVAIAMVSDAVEALKTHGLECDIVGGGGTGSYYFESNSGVYNELQCGSYAFMDADYGRIRDAEGNRIDQGEWENAMFLLTQVMSHAKADKAIVDAGLKAQSVDSGLPVIFGRTDVEYVKCSDEHGVVADPDRVLAVGDKLRLVPGHCDPTANVHDWYVGVRDGKVETLWPVSARGKAF
ncbi:DSD1 family PLP-dependent enzyme [Ponticoccus sp. SC2-23]|uniref:3-hydroxy-D-aspartate aldolase BhcC n=1 Tax=Alexandriicola marinus TaxID=2081710 RepID=UPI000FD9E5F8|nr:3-hydroxy-D-aspartate aldolase BhcC [Alexandriicola marinus]MBM1221650.1 DSD1 family PLP-dependent enzyme [Ponticoccus sp. SC6-9]MBM1226691.1 DSD1 family PLP-dependent enzyme [Ponticoccus sp. SC6-15]MBM1230642.1 DSD1 family PLP-dependent enzyme [Ponticoccus sp. SC6-38]MBM1235165.1 DSD1 family PLP-dependent enzyme [Ponticoccus sp. SC6-45]MBM1239663.1 DSD1 family PLP-dependent enzyme [Ponticoccus sp. SC6-49]MBM1243445.1 DSD1 family PLP-dependent enzyme [Ponticoccus sp. SC2-64]MBM1248689.1 D